jgi:hypothetical protein
MPADPLLDLIDEHIAAIEAAVPQDLTKIAVGGPTLGLEALVSASIEGDPAPAESPIDGGIPDNTVSLAAVPADLAQIGVGVGAAVTAINGNEAFVFLEHGLPSGRSFILGCRPRQKDN